MLLSRKLQRVVDELSHQFTGRETLADIDATLQRRRLEPVDHAMVKAELLEVVAARAPQRGRRLAATNELATDRPLSLGSLATDVARQTTPAVKAPIDDTLARLGFRLDGSKRYRVSEVDAVLKQHYPHDIERRFDAKLRLEELSLLQDDHGRPIADPSRWHDPRRDTFQAGGRSLSASAERPSGKILRDRYGQPITLKILP